METGENLIGHANRPVRLPHRQRAVGVHDNPAILQRHNIGSGLSRQNRGLELGGLATLGSQLRRHETRFVCFFLLDIVDLNAVGKYDVESAHVACVKDCFVHFHLQVE
ncbi:hypothetical protein ACTJLC_26420 [Paraburkholderia sp. 22099]|uniref:hypothetical protein n=1 Tax=Paraburkholderia sp. 22099 TaxID=3453875 RepID=UPI003F86C1BE